MSFLLLAALTASGTILCAQMVTIKLVNGRNGNPMSNSHVNVWVGTKRKEAMVIPTDKDGIARLRLTDNDNEADLHIREKHIGDNVVIDPIVKYDEYFRVNVPFVICYPHVRDYSWLAITDISTKQLLQQGIVWPNSCGKATASPRPGELTIFVRPLTWWEKLKE
ncbi:MAG TPA: hypothetical protein VGN39_18695 [Terriglobales bacterium]|nr:hypothetical protein [Terriglobales bacterium]